MERNNNSIQYHHNTGAAGTNTARFVPIKFPNDYQTGLEKNSLWIFFYTLVIRQCFRDKSIKRILRLQIVIKRHGDNVYKTCKNRKLNYYTLKQYSYQTLK